MQYYRGQRSSGNGCRRIPEFFSGFPEKTDSNWRIFTKKPLKPQQAPVFLDFKSKFAALPAVTGNLHGQRVLAFINYAYL